MFTFLVFSIYLQIVKSNALLSIIIQYTIILYKAIKEIKKLRVIY